MEMRIYKLALLLPLVLHMEPASADDSILYSKAELRFTRTQVMQEQLDPEVYDLYTKMVELNK